MATGLLIAQSIRANDPSGVFEGVVGQQKLQGISNGVSAWLLSSYKITNTIAGSGGTGACVGGLILNSGGSVGQMSVAMGSVLSGVNSALYIKAVALGISSLVYKVGGASVGVGVGAFVVTGGIGEPNSLYTSLRAGLVGMGLAYTGTYNDLELKALSSGIVSLFTVGVSGGGVIAGTPTPSFVSTVNAPLQVLP